MSTNLAKLVPAARAEQFTGKLRLLSTLYPPVMLGVFLLIPLCITLVVSVSQRVPAGFYSPGFDLSHYLRFFTPLFLRQTAFSFVLAAIAASCCVGIAFPFTYLLTQLSQTAQVLILIFILSVLSLSEVIISFSWSVLLSESAGLSNLLVFLKILPQAVAWAPGLAAVLLALIYRTLPFAVLVFYPAVTRLNPEVSEAAQTLGASPVRTFFDIILPMQRRAIVTAFLFAFIFAIGSYLIPQMLGSPQHWTISVSITDQAIQQSNLPFAAALSLMLMLLTLGLVWLISSISDRGTER
ncbi:ABC transporter permease [Leptolyngbya ohadii]|uniref:ABC transporter permease n=1 Tax=Leptolyngbya ohadii TaxID=1962290 RepID=UPI000B59FA30|nr:ABC transporter permease [Leptolyngbya ohadii]